MTTQLLLTPHQRQYFAWLLTDEGALRRRRRRVAWSRTPDDFDAMVRAELVKWAKVVKAAGIKRE